MGLLYGYRRTLAYLLGITIGFLGLMLVCAFVASTLVTAFPAFETVLRYAGTAYILWLAYEIATVDDVFDGHNAALQAQVGFPRGLLLQALNPKAIVFGMTQYATFLIVLAGRPVWLALSALMLAVVTFCAVSTWTLCGSGIRRFLTNVRVQRGVNTILALLLVYTALDILGIFHGA